MGDGLRRDPVVSRRDAGKRARFGILIVTVGIVLFSFSLGYATSELNWLPSRVKVSANNQLPDDLDYTSVEEVYDTLKRDFDGELSEAALLDGIKQGLAEASGDAYTVYLSAEQTTSFYDSLNGSFDGIGAELGLENGVLVVVAPIKGFPADKAGLRAGDIITKINNEETRGTTVEEAVVKIRGEKGTNVTLSIVRDNKEQDYAIVRETITVPSVKHSVIAGNIGHIELTRFAEDTETLMREAAEDLKSQNVKGIVLDLRNNSGGYVDAAVGVASLWQDKDQVVLEQRTAGVATNVEKATGGPTILKGLPTVVLINEGSASASEIVAGALKDNGHAKLVGATSYGKGSVQRLDELQGGATLKVTIARWFTPNGVNIDKDGIKPDIEVEMTEEDITAKRDPQLDKATQELR